MSNPVAFNARFISTFTLDRLYRVYIAGSDLCFIQIGGQAWGAPYGDIRPSRAEQERASAADTQDPRYLATTGKHNLLIAAGDIAASSIDPAPLLPQHGPCYGRWRIRLHAGRKLTFQFEEIREMLAAGECLPALLGATLAINAVWDNARGKFVRRQSP